MNRFIFIAFMLIIGINHVWAWSHPPPKPPLQEPQKPPEVRIINHGIER
ncbi:MAG: hypothetical protein QMC62_06165 [Alteromonadaceae bacterium]|jgi:hypothetical protein